jgi:hypothetical protein
MAQEVAVCACFAQKPITFARTLSDGKRDGDVWMSRLYLGDESAHSLVIEICVLAALKDKRSETCRISLLQTIHDLFRGQSIPFDLLVTSTDSAVKAVVATVVCEFHESTEIDFVSELRLSLRIGAVHGKREVIRAAISYDLRELRGVQPPSAVERCYEFFGFHEHIQTKRHVQTP